MTKPKAKSGGRFLAAAGVVYAAVTGGGIGTATYLDATRTPPRPVQEVARPREDPELLPPCTPDAVPKSELKPELKPEDPAIEQGTVTAAELNVRQTPAGRIVGQLYRGDKIDILERRANGGGVEWLRTPKGWVAARFVEIEVSIARQDGRRRPDAPEDLAPTCFPPGPWCPTPSPPFLPPLTPR